MSTKIYVEELLASTIFNTNITSGVKTTSQWQTIGVQVVWASLTGTIDGTITLEGSIDGTNFDAVNSPISITGASSNDCISLTNFAFPYIRLKLTKNNITGGTISAMICFKEC